MEPEYPEMDLSEFILDCTKRFCPYCGTAIMQNPRGRKKKFCSNKCRWAFHKRRKRKTPWEQGVVLNERREEQTLT